MRLATPVVRWILVVYLVASSLSFLAAQGSYRAQLRGLVSDAAGAVMANVTVTITETGTGLSSRTTTDAKGEYFFTGLRPSTYSVKAEASGFRISERTNVVFAVDQETTLNFTLSPARVNESIEVTSTSPLLDTESPTLGTDITNEYVRDIPLINRSFFGLTFLSGGVTEVAGSGTQDNYPSGRPPGPAHRPGRARR
jgi:hypothetical protein